MDGNLVFKAQQLLGIKVIETRDIPQSQVPEISRLKASNPSFRGSVQIPEGSSADVAFLNVATFAKHWMGFDPDLLERAVSVTASIASYCTEQKWGIGVYANGSVPRSDQPIRVPPGRWRAAGDA